MNLKVLDGYCTNLSYGINIEEYKIFGTKSRDCHVFLKKLLPLIVRDLLPRHVSNLLIELDSFFKDLYSKVLQLEDLDNFKG